MARKSKGLDKKLLKVGAAVLLKKGVAGLSIREVAKKAGVNLGMFIYYFRNKDQFIKAILAQAYTPFIQQLSVDESNPSTLEDVLFKMAVFSRDHQKTLVSLSRDLLSGNKNIVRFLEENFSQHFVILSKVLKLHFIANGYDQRHNEHVLRYLIASVGLSNLLAEVLNGVKPRRERGQDTDQVLKKRVKAAVKGIEVICT